MNLIIEGTVESITTRGDKTVRINFGTQEIDNDNAARLFGFRNSFCKLLLSSDNISKMEQELVAAHETVERRGTSPSKKLRNTLWKVWNQQKMEIPFENYYETEMNRINIHYQEKLT